MIRNDTIISLKDGLKEALWEAFEKASNVAVGSEEFDRFGSVPWSGRNGTAAIQQIIDWSNPVKQIDIVINFRSPRHTQWISIWKQLMSLEDQQQQQQQQEKNEISSVSYPEWICEEGIDQKGTAKVWEYLDCVSNPLGLTLHLLERLPERVKVWLIDMGGVLDHGFDISHVSACHILGLPCTDGWVRGINRTLVMNPKSRPLNGVSSTQLDEMNWILRQRDCIYQSKLEDFRRKGRLKILYPQDLSWTHCQKCSTIDLMDDDNDIFQNTTFLLQAMRSQFGCQSDHSVNLTDISRTSQLRCTTTTDKVRFIERSEDRQVIHQVWLPIQLLQWTVVSILFGSAMYGRRRRQRQHCGTT